MAPGAGRVEPNQRKRAGIRLRQAASAKATPKAFASEAAKPGATPNVFASAAARQGREQGAEGSLRGGYSPRRIRPLADRLSDYDYEHEQEHEQELELIGF